MVYLNTDLKSYAEGTIGKKMRSFNIACFSYRVCKCE
jgi:hypothetical protein